MTLWQRIPKSGSFQH